MSAPGTLIGFVPVSDADRAKLFYEEIVGLEFVADDGFALVFRSGTNMVRLARMPQVIPAQFTILGWETTEIEAEVEALLAKGVTSFQRYGFLEQDALGIWTSPNGNKVAWFTDPDGNVLSLSQH
jgi:catechol 2,3-dioxygenase-like lactoylglutathione lyase family enzyme